VKVQRRKRRGTCLKMDMCKSFTVHRVLSACCLLCSFSLQGISYEPDEIYVGSGWFKAMISCCNELGICLNTYISTIPYFSTPAHTHTHTHTHTHIGERYIVHLVFKNNRNSFVNVLNCCEVDESSPLHQ